MDQPRPREWGYRLRCRQDLLVFEDSGETTLAACFARGEHHLTGIELTEGRVPTNIAMVQEAGHPEPWIIALSDPPSTWRAHDYGLHWGIEALFSDFKTRGFNVQDSQIARTDRLDRLILVLSLALYWAVSTGMWDSLENKVPAENKDPTVQRRSRARSLTSFFKRGLRCIQRCLQRLTLPPPLWTVWSFDGW